MAGRPLQIVVSKMCLSRANLVSNEIIIMRKDFYALRKYTATNQQWWDIIASEITKANTLVISVTCSLLSSCWFALTGPAINASVAEVGPSVVRCPSCCDISKTVKHCYEVGTAYSVVTFTSSRRRPSPVEKYVQILLCPPVRLWHHTI